MSDSLTPDEQTVEFLKSEPGEIVTPNSQSVSAETNSKPEQEDILSTTNVFDIENELPQLASQETINWTAAEFIAHEKTAGWYGALLIGAIVAAFLVWLFTKSIFPVVVVAFCAVILAYFASHKPRELRYQIDEKGLKIENKSYGYHDFKSFSVLPEGNLASIVFIPLKRFLPPLTIYFDPADENKIVSVLSARIPLEPGRRDAVDRFITRIRF
jgi:hypothetical protein